MPTSIEVYNPMSAYNGAINTLEKNGIRATKQRRVLAKLIFQAVSVRRHSKPILMKMALHS